MDPTGLSSPFGQLVIGAGLLATIVVGIVALRRRRSGGPNRDAGAPDRGDRTVPPK